VNIEINSAFTDDEWNNIILSQSYFTVFHSLEWEKVLSKTYKFPFYVITIKHDTNTPCYLKFAQVHTLTGKKKGISLPFSDFCPPLCDYKFRITQTMIDYILKQTGWEEIEFRDFGQTIETDCFHENVEHKLILSQYDSMNVLRSDTRRSLKKAFQSPIRLCISTEEKSLNHFYTLQLLTRKRHGLPPQPFSFFKNIHSEFIQKDKGFYTEVYMHEKPIASCLFLHDHKNAVYKCGASDKQYQRYRPNNLIFWETIKHLRKKKLLSLSLGKTEKSNTGLIRFKQGWRPKERVMLNYVFNKKKKGFVKNSPQVKGPHNVFFSHAPFWITNLFSQHMYKYWA